MSLSDTLSARSEAKCELCEATENLGVFEIPPSSKGTEDDCAFLCLACQEQLQTPGKMDAEHWCCLSDTMWTQVPAVQVLVWRMLNRLNSEAWAAELLDMLYLEDETLAWAQAGEDGAAEDGNTVKHLDSNGALLKAGDTVTLVKDLNVKGANFTAKRGTAVRNISLVPDNGAQIEGRVSGQQIVILTEFVKKSV